MKKARKAAAAGSSYGLYALACCYEAGRGVAKDPVRALSYYKMAAQKNNRYALLMLGRCYEKGIGTDPDLFEARRWYARAAELDTVFAQEKVDMLDKAALE